LNYVLRTSLAEEECIMAKAVVDKEACVGCETCVGTCPVESISMVDGKAVVDDSCIECGSCVSVCPVNAISQ
jgi:NAD-dependent dihydropyrimidine dehydrogenase PreA subunit